MRPALFVLALVGVAHPAAAQLTTMYAGTQTLGSKAVPATAQFSVEEGRVAAIMTGIRGGRMVFDARAQVLHIISDENKTYIDIDKASGGMVNPMQAMEQQLAKMPPTQRAMAEQMMKSAMGNAPPPPPPLTYVWSTEKKKIAGYECTRVDGMRGNDKVTEYCGSTSADFKMSDLERKTMLAMQSYLRNFMIAVKTADDGSRAFQWDTDTDGHPVLTRCYTNGALTLDLTLQSVNHRPIPKELFEIPRDYKKTEIPTMGGRP
jgi:hypothetical protein